MCHFPSPSSLSLLICDRLNARSKTSFAWRSKRQGERRREKESSINPRTLTQGGPASLIIIVGGEIATEVITGGGAGHVRGGDEVAVDHVTGRGGAEVGHMIGRGETAAARVTGRTEAEVVHMTSHVTERTEAGAGHVTGRGITVAGHMTGRTEAGAGLMKGHAVQRQSQRKKMTIITSTMTLKTKLVPYSMKTSCTCTHLYMYI